jgi:PAS domain-containing protein
VSAEDHIGKDVTEVYPAIEEIGVLQALRDTFLTGQPRTVPLAEYEDGRIHLWVENYIFKMPSGVVVAVYNDVTARKLAEEEIKASERKFRRAIEYNIDAVVLVDKDGVVQYANHAMEKLTGVDEEDLLNKQFGFPLTTGSITSVDIVGTDGKTRCAEMRVSEIELDGEDFYIVSLRDFTEVPEPCEEDLECPIKDYSNESNGSRG